MRGSLRHLNDNGFAVTLVSSPGDYLDRTAAREGVRAVGVPMQRDIHPYADLRSLFQLYRLFRAERPAIVLAGTPKAGLLGTVAALLARVPVRVYVLMGLRLETERGLKKWILWVLEWLAMRSATRVVVVSHSLLAWVRRLRLLRQRQGVVLGPGTANGVDLTRFADSDGGARARLGVPADAFVFGFVGRLTEDKGVRELTRAFADLDRDAWLLVVGNDEGARVPDLPRLVRTGWLDDPVDPYHAMDALVLPTYREGFPTAPLEAAAAGKPTITTTATGAIDSVIGAYTGLLVPPRDVVALRDAMRRLVDDRERTAAFGARAREWVAGFAAEKIWAHLTAFLAGELSAVRPSVVVFTEARYGKAGNAWAAEDMAGGTGVWAGYRDVVGEVTVAARAREVPGAAGPAVGGVRLAPLPYYIGPRQLVRRLPRLGMAVSRLVRRASTVVVRLPGPVGTLAAVACTVRGKAYIAEVVGSTDALRTGAGMRVGGFLAGLADRVVRWQVRRAAAVRYVTAAALQQRYPPGPGVPSIGVSDVRITDADLSATPRASWQAPFTVVTVGTQETWYKGHDVLLRALATLRRQGNDVHGRVVGTGRYHDALRHLAVHLGLAEVVEFIPAVDRAELRTVLDGGDLFCMPSIQEGLPRALVEAMARGLPAVGTAVGGIPELLDAACVVPPGDDQALAEAIEHLIAHPEEWRRQSATNLDRAAAFHTNLLEPAYRDWISSAAEAR